MVDELLSIYRDAKKLAADGRFRAAGRERRVVDLENRVVNACLPGWTNQKVGREGTANDYLRLCNELMTLVVNKKLFVFVITDEVAPTNNASERQLRGDAIARRTGRTNKTPHGARRQSIISSVLQSIGKHVPEFRLQSVIDEIQQWNAVGQSCFDEMCKGLPTNHNTLEKGILKRVILFADA